MESSSYCLLIDVLKNLLIACLLSFVHRAFGMDLHFTCRQIWYIDKYLTVYIGVHVGIFYSSVHVFDGELSDETHASSEQALHEALMRQEELLAYLDRQAEAKLRVSFFIFLLGFLLKSYMLQTAFRHIFFFPSYFPDIVDIMCAN